MSWSRRLLGGVAALLLLLSGTSPAAASDVGVSHAAAVPELAWHDCGDGFECATASVPLDYDRPRGATIRLALIRLPATDPAQRIGSLFINPGGPGNSGVEDVRSGARTGYTAAVRARFDIIGMDPRGVAASTPVQCFASEAERQQFMAGYNVLPVNDAELTAATANVTELARRCHTRAGALLQHLSTANVARDLDLLRRAVGDAKLNYVGYSYGTYLGATYANMYPGKVRALVLDAVSFAPGYASAQPGSTPFLRANAHIGASETLDQFFVLCARAGTRCALNEIGDPRAVFATLAQRLREAPLVLPDGRRVGYAELVDLTQSTLYTTDQWATLASILQQVYAATDPAAAARHLAALVRDDPAQPYNNTLEALWANVCSETSNPRKPSAYADIAARADQRTPYVGAWWTYLTLTCAVWPARDADRYTGPWRTRTATPALLLNNRYDPATPHRNAVAMTDLLIGSRLVTVEGWGHKALATRSACADAIVERYLLGGTLPRHGTTCQPGIVPFAG